MSSDRKESEAVNTKFVFVRHGETEWNLEGRCQGWLNSDLTAIGKAGAIGVGKRLRAMHEKSMDYRFDVVYSSPLGRASDTARLVLQQFSDHDSKFFTDQLILDDRLKERNYGELQGKLRENFLSEFYSRDMDAKPAPSAETRSDLLKRVSGFINEKLEEHSGKTILIFAHGGVIGTFITSVIMDGLTPTKFPHTLSISNNSINIAEYIGKSQSWMVRRMGDNDTSIVDWMESVDRSHLLSVSSDMTQGLSFSMSSGSSSSSTNSTLMTTPRVSSMSKLDRYDLNPLTSSKMNVVLFTGVVFGLGVLFGLRLAQRKGI